MQWSKVALMLMVVDNEFYKNLLIKGHEKISKGDLEIINAHLIADNKKPITLDDINHIYANLVKQLDLQGSKKLVHEQLNLGLSVGGNYKREV